MSINSRRKGARTERALVRLLQNHGFTAEKVSRSGYVGPDLSVPLLGIDRRVEVKCRGNGFRQLYDWLDGADFLIVKADRLEPLVVVPLKFATEIARLAERAKDGGAPTAPALSVEPKPIVSTIARVRASRRARACDPSLAVIMTGAKFYEPHRKT
jgi:Holliday junction resolvase